MRTTIQQQVSALCCEHGSGKGMFAGASINVQMAVASISPAIFQDATENPDGSLVTDQALPPQSSRRTRIWELPPGLHCSIIGVCLPIDVLRRLVVKHYGVPCNVGDYEVHAVLVGACRVRSTLIDVVQRELDKRYQASIKRFQHAKNGDAVAALWSASVAEEDGAEDLAGALWASLTHPRTDDVLRAFIGHEIHMIQHQVGGETRRGVKELAMARQLGVERAAELEVARAKLAQMQAEHAYKNQSWERQLADAESAVVGVNAQNAALKLQLEALRQSVKKLDTRERLSLRVDALVEQNARLKQQLAELNMRRASDDAHSAAELDSIPVEWPAKPAPRVINLHQQSILCVGGRSGAVASYRDVVERAGGKFVHHDGGIEHNQHRLDAHLAAADCVVCQTGCISHNAYWLVKDYCKKTGKRCLYLDKPSVSMFVEGLSTLPPGSTQGSQASHASLSQLGS